MGFGNKCPRGLVQNGSRDGPQCVVNCDWGARRVRVRLGVFSISDPHSAPSPPQRQHSQTTMAPTSGSVSFATTNGGGGGSSTKKAGGSPPGAPGGGRHSPSFLLPPCSAGQSAALSYLSAASTLGEVRTTTGGGRLVGRS